MTATSSRPANRFVKGLGVYTCSCCGRQTRQTGRGDNDLNGQCAECYELAGEVNHISDTGEMYGSAAEVRGMFDALRKHGKSPEALFPEVATHLAKLAQESVITPAHTHRIVTSDGIWGRGTTVAEAIAAYRKEAGRDPKKGYQTWAVTASTRVDELGRFALQKGDPMPVDISANPHAITPVDINAANRDNKLISKLAVKEPSHKKAIQKPGRGKTLRGKKAAKAVAAVEPVTVSKGDNFKIGAKKVPAKKSTAPKGAPSTAMLAELGACAQGKPTQDKMGSCMRMHLKMRGLISDHKTGALTDAGRAMIGVMVNVAKAAKTAPKKTAAKK